MADASLSDLGKIGEALVAAGKSLTNGGQADAGDFSSRLSQIEACVKFIYSAINVQGADAAKIRYDFLQSQPEAAAFLGITAANTVSPPPSAFTGS